MNAAPAKPLRCVIYTRVSTDAGLEQEFNSLDNQREAAEAYIKSQAHEGWHCLPTTYDDGGFSGGSLDRPALQRLLADIRARRVDIVVVYKVDRLTRSLADFAKLVELFDAHEVSFVSVTQAFNTTNSMGRLTLNVLLSFAQFEREVTAERIRDKIAASKRKGMRMGGPVPLGYDVSNKKLVVNPEEAERVRLIFRRYLELGCLTKLLRDLEERGISTKLSGLRNGRTRGGIPFTKGPLAYLLKNRVYIGEVVHRGLHFPGEHEPILESHLFNAVQDALASRAQARDHACINNNSLLTGRIFDDRGNRMSPSTANRNGARYRYYVSAPLMQGRKEDAGSLPRVPAPELERLVLDALRAPNDRALEQASSAEAISDRELAHSRLEKVILGRESIEITLAGSDVPVVLPWTASPNRRRREVIVPAGGASASPRPIRSESRARLLESMAKSRLWLHELVTGNVISTKHIAAREGISDRSVRMTVSLAFLSPTITRAAVQGRLPFGSGMSRLADLPPCWKEQNGSGG